VCGVLPRGGRAGAGEFERRPVCSLREEVSAASLARLRVAEPALARTLSVYRSARSTRETHPGPGFAAESLEAVHDLRR